MAVRADARLPSRIARLVADALPGESSAVQVGIVGAGGSGSGEVLAEVAERLRKVGRQVLRVTGRRLERDETLGAVADVLGGLSSLPDDPTERSCREALLDRLTESDSALVVDEAQWLDPASLRVVVGIAERADDHGLTVVVAHRPAPGKMLEHLGIADATHEADARAEADPAVKAILLDVDSPGGVVTGSTSGKT